MSGSDNSGVHGQIGKLHIPREHRLLFPRLQVGKSKSACTGICFFRAAKKAKVSTGLAANSAEARCLGSFLRTALYLPSFPILLNRKLCFSSSKPTEVTNRPRNEPIISKLTEPEDPTKQNAKHPLPGKRKQNDTNRPHPHILSILMRKYLSIYNIYTYIHT